MDRLLRVKAAGFPVGVGVGVDVGVGVGVGVAYPVAQPLIIRSPTRMTATRISRSLFIWKLPPLLCTGYSIFLFFVLFLISSGHLLLI